MFGSTDLILYFVIGYILPEMVMVLENYISDSDQQKLRME
jgi:hypothetical protein